MRIFGVLALAALLSGCLVRTAADVATLPIKAAGKGVDMATTSQEEADRNRGREMRKQEEQEEKERRRQQREEQERQSQGPYQ